MCYFDNFEFMSEKQDVQRRQRFLGRFVSCPYNCLKNLTAAVNVTKSATRIFLKGKGLESKAKFFTQKFSNLGPVLNKLMQLKRITERELRAEPPAAG